MSNEDRALARALARLVRDGIAIYSGFTPTDAAHVLGKASHWSTRAAELTAIVWARQMRQVYGWGKFEENDPKGPSSAVEEHMVRTICAALVSACGDDGVCVCVRMCASCIAFTSLRCALIYAAVQHA